MKYKTYPKMKDSGVDWIGKIPEHWEFKKRLKFSTYLRSNKSRNELDVMSYVGLENVESSTGKLIDVNDEMNDADAKLFKKNDVLLGKLRPYLAKVWLAEFSGRCSSEFLVLKGIDYEPKFLSFLLLSDSSIKTIDSSTYGAKMPRAEWDFIGNMRFPIPPVKEQKQIVKFLDEKILQINKIMKKNNLKIPLLEEYIQSLIFSAVTGKICVTN